MFMVVRSSFEKIFSEFYQIKRLFSSGFDEIEDLLFWEIGFEVFEAYFEVISVYDFVLVGIEQFK